MATPVEAGTTFATAFKTKHPALAAQMDAILAAPDAVEELGRSVLMREDHSRLNNAAAEAKRQADQLLEQLRGKQTEQEAWYATAKDDLELGRKARAAAWTPADPNLDPNDPSKRTPTGLTLEDVNKLQTEREVGQALFVTTLNDLSMRHFQRFNEVLDTRTLTAELMRDPAARERGLEGHYKVKFADRIAAADKAAADADFETRFQARHKDEVAKLRSAPPYPTGGAGDPGSPLDALEPAKPASGGADVDAAVVMYTELVKQGAAR